MLKKFFMFIVFFITNLTLSFCSSHDVNDISELRETLLLARQIWEEIDPILFRTTNSYRFECLALRRDMVQKVDKLRLRPKFYDNAAVGTVIAKFDVLLLFHNSEIIYLLERALSESNVSDWVNIALPYISLHLREPMLTESEITFCPLLLKSSLVFSADINWEHDPSPFVTSDSHYPLELIFERIGLYDKAWRIQMEIGRKNYYYVPYHTDGQYNSYYLCAANNAYRSGNKKLGWSFLMNAAIFEHKKSFDLAMETAKIWIDVEAGKRELLVQKILTGDERKKAFLEIVERYQEMNAHPRAWLFIQENKNEFDDADGLIKKVQDDWLEVVKIATDPQIAKKVVMYGVELYPAKNDPLSVKIPWHFPEGSVEKLKAKIQEVADKIKEEEKDGLLDWYFSDGKLAVKAKYISCNDMEVTVERENGKEGIIKIARLADGNKNYVYRRLAIRNMAIEVFCTLFHKWNLTDKKLADIDAEYLSIDKENQITLQLKDGKKESINLSELNKTEQEYIKIGESWQAKEREEQKQKLTELKKRLLSEVTFRQWKSADEYFNTQAKFISYDFQNQTVTIEKPDGKQTTMEFSNLCKEDKTYLKNLLNPKLPKDNKK
jgi:hypothetical protein